jgi:hypothetical protein
LCQMGRHLRKRPRRPCQIVRRRPSRPGSAAAFPSPSLPRTRVRVPASGAFNVAAHRPTKGAPSAGEKPVSGVMTSITSSGTAALRRLDERVRIISTSSVLAFGVAVAVIARTERAICSASSRLVCRPRAGPDGTFHLDNRYPGRGQFPRAAQESVSSSGAGRAGLRTHPHASHDAAPSLTYSTVTRQTRH